MPDGKGVLFASNRSGTVGTFIIQVKDRAPVGEPELIKQITGHVEPLGFAKDGSYYYGLLQQVRDIYVAELDHVTGQVNAPAEKAIPVFEGSNEAPEYSPDGRYLAYVSMCSPSGKLLYYGLRDLEAGSWNIIVRDLESGNYSGSSTGQK